jgi:hypothetical protein
MRTGNVFNNQKKHRLACGTYGANRPDCGLSWRTQFNAPAGHSAR